MIISFSVILFRNRKWYKFNSARETVCGVNQDPAEAVSTSESASDLRILLLTFPRRPWDFCSFSNDWKVASSLPVLITGWNGVNWLERFFFLWERAESPGTDPAVNSLYVCLRPIHMQRLDKIIKSWHLHVEKQKWNGVLIKNLLVRLVHETDREGVISEPFCEICF